MKPIDIDTSSYESARDTFYEVDSQACDAVLIAATGADGGGGMAGSDSSGVDWSRQYDQVASQALQAGGTLTETLGHIGDLLGASAVNHGNADSQSIPGGGPTYGGGGSGKGASTVYPATPPSANGTPGNEPHGWFLIAHLLSWTWPNGHQDQLRSVAQAWTQGGQALQDDSLSIYSAISQIESLQSPEVAAAAQTCRDVQTRMNDLGGAYKDIGKTCDDYAGFIDEAHQEVISELESLIAWTVAIEAAGALGSLVTFGGAEVPAQVAEAGRIARTAAKVGEILSKLAELTRGIIAVIGRALSRVGEILAKLKGLLSKGVSRAVERVGAAFGRQAERDMDDILGKLRPGKNKPNLEVDTPEEVQSTFNELTRGAERVDAPNHPAGVKYIRADGTTIYLRQGSASGGPTIDIFKPSGTYVKVHLPKGWKP